MFGRLLSFEPDATGVTVKFEHKEGRISFITDRIVRVYSSMEEKHRPSRAVVQEPKKVDFLTPDGRMISEQTERTTKKQEITAQQAELLAKEGHELPKKQSDHTFEVVRMLHPKEHIYGLGD